MSNPETDAVPAPEWTSALAHPELQGLRRFLLATRDAHTLYAQFGFAPPARPQTLMELRLQPAWLLPQS